MTKEASVKAHGTPRYPYTPRPNTLRKILKLIPDRPKPSHLNIETMKGWGVGTSGNDYTAVRVLKAVNLIDANNATNDVYERYMDMRQGPAVLGSQIKEVYSKLFENYHHPHKESNDTIRRLFNTYSGGASGVIDYQVQTFKVLCEFAEFDSVEAQLGKSQEISKQPAGGGPVQREIGATIHIDLHIHLPENKSARDYEAILQDIGKYIMGRKDEINVPQ